MGVFVVEPLERAMVQQFAKSTSSRIPGFTSRCSCHSINIEGVTMNLIPFQESVEDVMQIILNVKRDPC